MNIQQQNTSGVFDTDKVMADNEELDPPPPQVISNVFAASDLSPSSSSDSAKYKRAWLKAKVIRSSILSAGECPGTYNIELYIALNHKEIAPIMAVTVAIFQKKLPIQILLIQPVSTGPAIPLRQ